MGELIFGPRPDHVVMDDRVLAHVKLVVLAKFRRGEAFAVNFRFDQSVGGGRSTIWLTPTDYVAFAFDGGRRPAVNRTWLDALMASANSTEGLHLLPEPTEEPPAPPTEPITVLRPLL